MSTYRPVPPLANVANPDGSVDRVILIGIRTEAGPPLHRIVGVSTGEGSVVTEPLVAALEWNDECGAAPPDQECPSVSGPAQIRVGLATGEEVLWQLLVVRPSASSGTNGSGVELREVDYKGQRVLERAHLPIVNVQDAEAARPGAGRRAARGCTRRRDFGPLVSTRSPASSCVRSSPSTIGDTGDPEGDFRGVALWKDGDDLLIVSQLQAGWYRYVTEWRLRADGTIQPRFGVSAIRNPCACRTQVHHAYWRFDFDILGAANNLVQEHNDQPVMGTSQWHTTHHEVRRPRDAAGHRYWRVRNVRSSQGYSLVPGEDDGDADEYGVGAYGPAAVRGRDHDGQGHHRPGVVARPDRPLRDGRAGRTPGRGPLVRRSPAPGAGSAGRRIGPDLVPSNWRDLPTNVEKFAPPEPPTMRS